MRRQFLSHRIALSKIPTNLFSGEPPSKRLVLVLCALLRHSWALLLARPHTLLEIGELKACSRSLCDAPIDMWLCEEAGPGLRQSPDRPVHRAALCCLMLYLFELMANASGFSAANQATQCLFRDGQ